MERTVRIVVCSVALLVLGAGSASACNTGSWLQPTGVARPGEALTVRGGGFAPGPLVLRWDRSAGAVVGEAEAGADGRFEAQVTVPADAGGAHKIVAGAADGAADAGESPADPHAWVALTVATPGWGGAEPEAGTAATSPEAPAEASAEAPVEGVAEAPAERAAGASVDALVDTRDAVPADARGGQTVLAAALLAAVTLGIAMALRRRGRRRTADLELELELDLDLLLLTDAPAPGAQHPHPPAGGPAADR